jgi:hypothetical protein
VESSEDITSGFYYICLDNYYDGVISSYCIKIYIETEFMQGLAKTQRELLVWGDRFTSVPVLISQQLQIYIKMEKINLVLPTVKVDVFG